MSIKRSLIKNAGFNLVGYFYLLVASFFSISVILNNLGRDVFGLYIFLASFISLSAVIDFGLSNAVVRRLSLPQTTRDEKVRTWKTSFSIFLVLAVILSSTVLVALMYLSQNMSIFTHLDHNSITHAIIILGAIVLVNHINCHFLNLPQAEQRFDIFNSKTLLVGSANTIVTALVSSIYPNIAVLFLVQLVFHILTLAFMILYSMRIFRGREFLPGFDKDTGRNLFSFGIKNFLGTLAGQAENQLSNLLLGALGSAKAITAFSIPQNIVIKGAGVFSQFAQAFFPLSASLLERDRIKKLKKLALGMEALTLVIGTFAVILAFSFGEQFLLWWLKDSVVVSASYPILKILSFYFLLISLTPILGALLQGLNKPQIPSFFGVLTVTLEILFSLSLIHLGAIGIAYAYLLSVSITVPLLIVVTWRQLNREISKTNLSSSSTPQLQQ